MKIKIVCSIIILMFSAISLFTANVKFISPVEFETVFKEREAKIWYLGHSGWAIRTKNHLLIFDYCRHGRKMLSNPAQSFGATNYPLYVFVSHQHRDHFDTGIFDWEKAYKNIHYIIGWNVLRIDFNKYGAEKKEIHGEYGDIDNKIDRYGSRIPGKSRRPCDLSCGGS
jgi:metal-dependent hydrolase (beta-lactamase superfamily II)